MIGRRVSRARRCRCSCRRLPRRLRRRHRPRPVRRVSRPRAEPALVQEVRAVADSRRARRVRTRCATRSARHPIRWARTTATNSCGRSFPDYPRPAIWPDGYYVPTSTSDNRISETVATQKHACVADRAKMLKGEPATRAVRRSSRTSTSSTTPTSTAKRCRRRRAEHHDGRRRQPARRHLSGQTSSWCGSSTSTGRIRRRRKSARPVKIPVAPYHYLCGGQLTNCVPQPGTDRRLDAQGDKIMARLVYRRIGNRESIVAVHSVNTEAAGGGVRWYEFRIDAQAQRHALSAGHVRARWQSTAGWPARRSTRSATSASATRSADRRLCRAALRRPPGQRSARPADAQRDGPGRRRRRRRRPRCAGRTTRTPRRSVRRLHDLVRRRLLQEGRDDLLDEDWRVQDSIVSVNDAGNNFARSPTKLFPASFHQAYVERHRPPSHDADVFDVLRVAVLLNLQVMLALRQLDDEARLPLGH